MNKHLKPGVAVDVRGASDEVKEQIMREFVSSGASRGIDDRVCNFISWGSSSKKVYFFGGDSVLNYKLISINQALGRDSEVESNGKNGFVSRCVIVGQSNASSDWFERGELPPVGTKVKLRCPEFDRDHDFEFDGAEAEILLHRTTDNGNKVAVFVSEHGDYHALVAHCFRPLKTEKEKFVHDLVFLMNDNTNSTFTEISGVLYDKGLRFID